MSPAASRIPQRGPPKDWNGFLRERTLALARRVPAIQFRSAQRSRYSSSALAFLTARQVPKSFGVHVLHRVQRCPLPASILLFLRRPSEPGGLRGRKGSTLAALSLSSKADTHYRRCLGR